MSNINPENGLNSQHNDDAKFDPSIAELSDRCVRLNGLSFVMPGTTTLNTFPTPKPKEAELMERTFCKNNGIVTFSSPEGSFATTTKLPDGRSVTDLLSGAGYAYENQPVPLSNGEIIVSDPEAEKAWTEILTGSLLKGAEITVIENRKRALGKYLVQVTFGEIVNADPGLADMLSGTVLDEELRSLLAGGLPPPDHPDPLA